MATVSLRPQEHQTRSNLSPRLLLLDCAHTSRSDRTRRRAHRQNLWETLLFAVAAAAVLLFCLVGAVQSLTRDAVAASHPPLIAGMVLPVTVHPGDTLWTYAQKYETPDTYILDRVETIARANHLSADTPLVPGQHLRIPVTNPVIVAQFESRHRLARR